MREPKCALNLPNIIGQTPTVPSRESGSPPSRRPNSPLSRRYGRKPGIAGFIGRHIFNRSFRNDVNAGVIPFGERTAIKVSSLASKLGRPMDQPDPAHLATRRDFLRRDGRPLRRHCARQPTRDAVPAADRKVSKNKSTSSGRVWQNHMPFNARMLWSPCKLSGGRMIGVLTHHWAKVDKIDEARKLLDRNGDAQSKAPGFVSRQTLIALADPAKITTLVVWTTNDIYEAWRASPQRTMAMSGADRLWAKPPESERFQLVG